MLSKTSRAFHSCFSDCPLPRAESSAGEWAHVAHGYMLGGQPQGPGVLGGAWWLLLDLGLPLSGPLSPQGTQGVL